ASGAKLSIPGRGEETPTVHPAATAEDRPEVVYDRVGTAGAWRLSYERPPERGAPSSAPRREEQAFGVNVDPAEGALFRASWADVRSRVPGADLDVSSGAEEQAPERAASREGEVTKWLLFL